MSKKLQDCCSFQEGYVNPSQKDRSFFGGDIKWLRSMDLNNSHIYDTSQHLTNKGFLSAGKSAFMFPKHSIAISKSGTIGELGILEEEMCGNRAVIDIMVDENKADLMYVFYTLKYKKAEIIAKSVGSIQKNLYISELEKISLNHDNIEEQAKISNVLQLIDDKIEINNKINAELESMAKTIYDYWFLQFEFQNEDGKPYKSSGGKMVWNEELKREIPEGWEVQSIFQCMDTTYGLPLSTDYFSENKGVPVIRIRDILENTISAYTTEGVEERYLTEEKDLLIGMDGNFHMNFWARKGDCVNQRIFRIRDKDNVSALQIYYEIAPVIKAREANVARSTVGHLSDKDFKSMNILISNNVTIYTTFDMLLDEICKNKRENQQLASLRDFLLPMLMNGQVGFKDGE